MKLMIMSGILALSLSMDVEANLPNRWSQVQLDAQETSHSSPFLQNTDRRKLMRLSDITIDLGIHGPIGRHGYFDIHLREGRGHRYFYVPNPHYRYWRPRHHHVFPPGHWKKRKHFYRHYYHRPHREYRHRDFKRYERRLDHHYPEHWMRRR